MVEIARIIIGLVIICFSLVLMFGAPYLPTLKSQVEVLPELAGLKAGDHVLELGCGDGRVMLALAKQGIKVTGYELNPIMFVIAWLRTIPVRSNASVIWGNFFQAKWPEADVIFVFLLKKYMPKLDKKCIQYPHKPVKLISFAFKVPNKKIVKSQANLYVYLYK